MTINVKVHPAASKNELIEHDAENFEIFCTAPAHDNLTNKAIIKMLSDHLNVAASLISIYKGPKSKNKIIKINQL